MSVDAPEQLKWRQEAQLRLPDLDFVPAGVADAKLRARLRFAQLDATHWRIELDTDSGQSLSKELEVLGEDPARELVVALENLLAVAGIEADPPRVADPAPENEEGQAEAEADSDPEAKAEELVGPQESETPSVEEAEAPTLLTGPWIYPWFGGGALFGLAQGNPVRGGSGTIGLDLQVESGFAVTTGLRITAARPASFTLARFRWTLGVGYVFMRRNFELATFATLNVEGWRVRQSGSRVGVALSPELSTGRQLVFEVTEGGQAEVTRGLLGFGLQLEPRLRLPIDRGPLDSAFVGVRLGSTYSGLPPRMAGLSVVSAIDRTRAESANAGGPELGAMLTAGLRFGHPEKKSKAPKSR